MSALAAGTVLGDRFTLLGELGQGGAAVVYLAEDRVRGEKVALKVLHAPLARRPTMRGRMQREVQAAGRVRHEGALVAYELHELDGRLCLSMPLHPGRTLAERIEADGPLSAAALTTLGARLADVLAVAHRAGVLHRDLTPSNVMLSGEGEEGVAGAALLDFGLARTDDAQSRTATGTLGTVGYAAPEVYEGVRSDPRSDLYGLGAVLYFAATGRSPFAAAGPMGVLKRQLAGDQPPLREERPDLPEALCATVDALLKVEPADRPAGAREVAALFAEGRAPEREAPSREGPARGAPPKVPRFVRPPRLPGGSWVVDVSERGDSRQRRQRLRRAARGAADLEVVLAAAWEKLQTRLVELFELPQPVPPETQLVRAVERAAGLPGEALRPTPALLEPEFRLVEGVDGPTAAALAQAAKDAGFRAGARDTGASGDTGPGRGLVMAGIATAAALLVLLVALMVAAQIFAGAAVVGAVAGASWKVVGVVALVVLAAVALGTVGRAGVGLSRLLREGDPPVAYRADLSDALSADYATAMGSVATPEASAGPVDGAARDAAPASPPGFRHPTLALVERLRVQLNALDRALSARTADLPEPVARDLRTHLGELRERVEGLGREATLLVEEAVGADPDAAVLAAARVEDRLARLDALVAAGQPEPSPGERAALEASLAGHRAAAESREQAEAALTRVTAALLEIGAALAEARRSLGEGPSIARSSERAAGRLREEVRAAASAMEEVDADARRARQAAARLRQGG